MYLQSTLATVETVTFTQAITPFIPLLGTVAGAIVVGVFAAWNRRRGAVETRAPEVSEIWQQQALESKSLDLERRLRRALEDMIYELRRAFKLYVARVHTGGSKELSEQEEELLRRPLPELEDFSKEK